MAKWPCLPSLRSDGPHLHAYTVSPKFWLREVGITGEAGEAACLLDEPVPCRTGGIEHRRIVAVQAMREEALAQVEPDTLDGIEFGAASGQRQQRDVVRHHELGGEM